MADINLSPGDDVYVQLEADKNVWNNVFGLAGNDTISLYQGTAIGGPGNDSIIRLVDPGNANRTVQAAYWSAGPNLLVNLAEGWANDGEGGRDTLVGVTQVSGSGAANALVIGDANNNYYWPNWGTDTFEGGAGWDGISLNSGNVEVSPGKTRSLFLDEINIVVSADGRTASFTPKVGPAWSITTRDVEYFDVRASLVDSDPWAQYRIADFILPQTMAEQAIAAGGSLRWNASSPLGTGATLSYSFVTSAPPSGPGATGFRAFSETERALVREILAGVAQFTQLNFAEVSESGSTQGQLRFGVSQQAATKGFSTLPNQPGAGDAAGDVWMDVDSMLGIATGGEGYQALLHEIGHALGLRHPRNTDAGDAWAMQLRAEDDRTALTAMSGTASADGLFRADWGPLDVLALRSLYGSRAMALGNDRYVLGTLQANRETTLVDDGGIDTLDASGLATGVQLTLVPGTLSNVGISNAGIYGVDNLALPVGTVIENAIGTASDDELIGNDADNRLTGGLGNDWIDGGAGSDTAVFAGQRGDYEIDHAFGFTYVRARDGASGFDTLVNIERLEFADQTLSIAAAAPLAQDINVNDDEDTVYSGSLPLPDGASDRSGLSWSLAGNPAHGTASVLANGDFSYTPAANYWGSDSFAFRVGNSAGSNSYRVYVAVKPVNDAAPQGRSQTLMLAVGAASSGHVPTATDVDGDSLAYSVTGEPQHGSLAFAADGAYTYTPEAGFYGDDSFGYTVSDGMGGSSSYTMTLRVGLRTNEDTPLQTTLPDPLDAARSAASYRVATPPAKGLLTVSAQGQLSFTPQANAHGQDSFAYEIVVGDAVTRITVGLDIVSVNDGPPLGANASYPLNEDSTLTQQLPAAVDPDGDPVRYELATPPTLGSATISATGLLTYTPRANLNGADALSVVVRDSEGGSNSYSVTLNVLAINDAPVAAPASASLLQGQTLVGVLPAASDADGDRVSYTLAGAPAKGQVSISGIGLFTYVPNPGASGSDSFGYSVRDGKGGSSSYTVSISLKAVAAASGEAPSVSRLALAHTSPAEGTAVDSAFIASPREGHVLLRSGDALTVYGGDTAAGGTPFEGIERLFFSDQLLAFGGRAEEVARVAFALWSPAVADSTTLFARGLAYYDGGASFAQLVQTALQFWPEQGADFADLLLRQSGTPRSQAELLALMQAAGGGEAGRAAAVSAVAWDDSTTALLHSTGLINQGIVADLWVPGFGQLFPLPGGA